jgi:GDPmannose 4,6-dehydratase
MTRH